jgi:hypothetical protein
VDRIDRMCTSGRYSVIFCSGRLLEVERPKYVAALGDAQDWSIGTTRAGQLPASNALLPQHLRSEDSLPDPPQIPEQYELDRRQ